MLASSPTPKLHENVVAPLNSPAGVSSLNKMVDPAHTEMIPSSASGIEPNTVWPITSPHVSALINSNSTGNPANRNAGNGPLEWTAFATAFSRGGFKRILNSLEIQSRSLVPQQLQLCAAIGLMEGFVTTLTS